MLLIATNRHELAADYLILRLRERKVPFCRFNTETLGRDTDLEITCGQDDTDFRLVLEDASEIRLADVHGVYFHHAVPPSGAVPVTREHAEFADNELLESLRSLWRLIPEVRWLNHPRRLWRAENKVEQLIVARSCHLSIPDTLITRRAKSIQRFIRKHDGRVVVKAVRQGFVLGKDGMELAGTRLLPARFHELLDNYAAVPAVYQQALAREADVRVVVVDKEVFPIAITGSEDHVDWRVAELDGKTLHYIPVQLPRPVEQACVGVVNRFGLRYSSMDLLLTDAGEFVFLELNPSGQWAWLEQLTGCPIRDAIIDALHTAHA